ncbi:MAG: hypothetical protein ABW022_15815 [Actinoplanes sp.]
MTAAGGTALVVGHAVSPAPLLPLLVFTSTAEAFSLRPSAPRFGWLCECGTRSDASVWWPSDVEAVLAGVTHTAVTR